MKKITLQLPSANELTLNVRRTLPPGGRTHATRKGKGSYDRKRAKQELKNVS